VLQIQVVSIVAVSVVGRHSGVHQAQRQLTKVDERIPQ